MATAFRLDNRQIVIGANKTGSYDFSPAETPVLEATAVFPASTPAGVGGYQYIDDNGDTVPLVSVVSQSGATRTWSISSGRLIADGTPGVDDTVVIRCTTASDTVDITIDASTDGVAISSTAEWFANANSGKGKLIYVRKGAACDVWSGNHLFPGTYPLDKTDSIGTTILGEGYEEEDEDGVDHYHFLHLRPRSWRNVDFEDLNIRAFYEYNDTGDTANENLQFTNCSLVVANVDPNGDYGAAPPSSEVPFYTASNAPTTLFLNGLRMVDCVLAGGGDFGGIRTTLVANVARYCEIIGTRFALGHEDFIKINGPDGIMIAGCEMTEPTLDGNNNSTGGHIDFIQASPNGTSTIGWGMCIEATTFGRGRGRAGDGAGGTYDVNCAIFLKAETATSFHAGVVRGCAYVGKDTLGFYNNNPRDAEFSYCGLLPEPVNSFPLNTEALRISFGIGVSDGTSEVHHCFAPNISVNVSDDGHDNVSMNGWSTAQLDAAVPDWIVPDGRGLWEEIMAAMTPAAGQALEGKGPSVIISKTPGAKLSTYVAAVDTPSLTPTEDTVGSTTATIAVATNIPKGHPIYWAVVPRGTSVANIDAILKRRITGAVVYGVTQVQNVASVDVPITGLTPETDYDFVCFQRNGWSKNSGVVRLEFTTAA